MKTSIETVTPAQAAKWLEPSVNRDNRAVRQKHVEMLAQQIIDGKWQVTHQGIAFGKDGRLLDGQHRLAAIVSAGKAVQMQVTRGLEDEVFNVTDCGLTRTHFDRIHLVDDPIGNRTICTAINTYLKSTTHRGSSPPISKIEDAFLAYDGRMTDSWLWIGREWRVRDKLSRAGVLASLAVYHFINPAKATEFADGYRTGANLPSGSAILALQRAVMNNPGRVDYWVAQRAMRQHLNDKTSGNAANGVGGGLSASLEDMLGFKNSKRLIHAKVQAAIKGAQTRKANRSAAAAR